MTALDVSTRDRRDNLSAYRASEREQQRIADLLELMPASGALALDVGARDGYLSRLMAERFAQIVALDLVRPSIAHARIECRKGDVTTLPFADETFDTVLCAEVLEHISPASLDAACRELVRVAKHSVIVGVPYRQDLRCGRTTCRTCGAVNPPWGHVNAFDESRLCALFAPHIPSKLSYVASTNEFTNQISAALMNFAGNPYGTYGQDEPCVHCGARLSGPSPRTPLQRVATRLAFAVNLVQRHYRPTQAGWMHARFDKRSPGMSAPSL